MFLDNTRVTGAAQVNSDQVDGSIDSYLHPLAAAWQDEERCGNSKKLLRAPLDFSGGVNYKRCS
jgi:hypothetical protein